MEDQVLFDFATRKDFEVCRVIVAGREESSASRCEDLDDLTRQIMQISYSIGGSYDVNTITSVTRCVLGHPAMAPSLKQKTAA